MMNDYQACASGLLLIDQSLAGYFHNYLEKNRI
jgi:hypothetical protein